MSAFMVSQQHIDVLVRACVHGPDGREVSPDAVWHSFSWYAREFSDCETPEEFYAGHRKLVNHDTLKGNDEQRTPSELGELLWSENAASIRYRYEDADEAHMLDEFYLGYEYAAPKCKLSPVAILKAIDCYEYQACEHPDWQTSEARVICQVLRSKVIDCLTGYKDAPWEWDEVKIAEQHRRDTMDPKALAELEAQEKAEADAERAAYLRLYAD